MSRLSRLLMLAAITSAASHPYGSSFLPNNDRPLPKFKGETPRCKTCVHFKTRRECCTPMQMACNNYSRKKKRR